MAVTTVNLTGDIADLLGGDFDSRRTKVWIETNIDGDVVVDSENNKIRLGDAKADVATDGTFAFTGLVATNSTTNPTGFQYRVWVDYATRRPAGPREKWNSGWFSLTATLDLAAVVAEQYVPPTYVTQATQQLDAHAADLEADLTAATSGATASASAAATSATEAEGYAQQARDISNIDTPDALVKTLIEDSGSETAGALTDSYAEKAREPRIHHLDTYNRFFGGGKWVTGQGNTATTLTAAVAAGASMLPVASATGIVAGQQLVVAEGTAQQKVYTVASVAGSDVTIVGTVTYALASGAAVTPLWTNSSHLTVPGYRAFAYFIANATTQTGEYVITGTAPKVTFLGNSWISQGLTVWGDELDDRIPGATAVNAGVSGNKSSDLLARFDADVPADSNYVVFNEPGVNDDTSFITPSTQSTQFQRLVEKILAIGATPVYAGHVPLADLPTFSAGRSARTVALLGTDGSVGAGGTPDIGTAYSPEADSVGLGANALLKVTTGTQNTALGVRAGASVTTGVSNTFIGREAGTAVTTGNSNLAIGQNSLRALTTGSNNTAIGTAALAALATNSSCTAIGANAGLFNTAAANTFIGTNAGYSPAGVPANATTTGTKQTIIGTSAGMGSATQADDVTLIGFQALATGYSTTAIGSGANAGAHDALALGKGAAATGIGSVAIGTDNSGAAASTNQTNEIALGTALHNTKILGWLRLERGQTTVGAAGAASALPATPTKYLSVKDSTGTEYVFPVYAKA